MLEALDADAVRRWSRAAVESLDAHRAEIDELNVFPVPDGDTGTNLALTLRAAADALAADGAADAAAALRIFARGAVLGARGNSGVIAAQFLRGLADAAGAAPTCDGAVLRAGLRLGADEARAAVAEPVEGTILTVAREAAADATRRADARCSRSCTAPRSRPTRRCSAPPSNCPSWPGRGWSTPAAAGWCCCSTPSPAR